MEQNDIRGIYVMLDALIRIADRLEDGTASKGDSVTLRQSAEYFEMVTVPIDERRP